MEYAAHGSLLLGDVGAALVVMRLDPTPAIADRVCARADANTTLPVRELMWRPVGAQRLGKNSFVLKGSRISR